MATDWTARTAAIEHFEKLVKHLKRVNDDDKELYEAALHALRRSQDHTAIQTKLQSVVDVLRQIVHEYDQTYDADCEGETWTSAASIPNDVMERAKALLK